MERSVSSAILIISDSVSAIAADLLLQEAISVKIAITGNNKIRLENLIIKRFNRKIASYLAMTIPTETATATVLLTLHIQCIPQRIPHHHKGKNQ